jgi:hypothetical protein
MRTKILKRHLLAIQKDLSDLLSVSDKSDGITIWDPPINALDRVESILLEAIRAGHDVRNPSNGNRAKTHCQSGHEYSGDNVKFDRHGHRSCRQCQAVYNRERYIDNIKTISAKKRVAWLKKKTHCANGHRLTEDNIILDGRGARRCRKCKEK